MSMRPPDLPLQRKGLTAIDGALALIILLLVMQMWLLWAALDAFLAGQRQSALPAAIVSGVLFLGCAGLFVFVVRLDAQSRKNEY